MTLFRPALLFVVVVALGVYARCANAQTTTVLVNPTAPTKKVTTTTTGGKEALDVNVAASAPGQCTIVRKDVTAVSDTSAVAVPTSAMAGRRWVDLCVSIENTGTPVVKCREDGVAPVIGAASPGDALNSGDCIRYTPPSGTTIQCIANTTNVAVTSTECSN